VIRRATAADTDALTALAHAAKRHWRYPEEWIALWRRDLTFTPELIERFPVYVAEEADAIAGVYALVFAAADCELEHFWVAPMRMGAGIGRALFAHAVERCRAIGARRLWINADPNAEGFYARMGARRVGEVPSTPAGRTLPRLELLTG
jgi:N-acetylglutamate synthase-like GNAT family acetyltransferase